MTFPNLMILPSGAYAFQLYSKNESSTEMHADLAPENKEASKKEKKSSKKDKKGKASAKPGDAPTPQAQPKLSVLEDKSKSIDDITNTLRTTLTFQNGGISSLPPGFVSVLRDELMKEGLSGDLFAAKEFTNDICNHAIQHSQTSEDLRTAINLVMILQNKKLPIDEAEIPEHVKQEFQAHLKILDEYYCKRRSELRAIRQEFARICINNRDLSFNPSKLFFSLEEIKNALKRNITTIALSLRKHYTERTLQKCNKARSLPEKAVSVMNKWFLENRNRPYPTEEQKRAMAQSCNISLEQVSNWFSNRRIRLKKRQTERGEGDFNDQIVLEELMQNKGGPAPPTPSSAPTHAPMSGQEYPPTYSSQPSPSFGPQSHSTLATSVPPSPIASDGLVPPCFSLPSQPSPNSQTAAATHGVVPSSQTGFPPSFPPQTALQTPSPTLRQFSLTIPPPLAPPPPPPQSSLPPPETQHASPPHQPEPCPSPPPVPAPVLCTDKALPPQSSDCPAQSAETSPTCCALHEKPSLDAGEIADERQPVPQCDRMTTVALAEDKGKVQEEAEAVEERVKEEKEDQEEEIMGQTVEVKVERSDPHLALAKEEIADSSLGNIRSDAFSAAEKSPSSPLPGLPELPLNPTSMPADLQITPPFLEPVPTACSQNCVLPMAQPSTQPQPLPLANNFSCPSSASFTHPSPTPTRLPTPSQQNASPNWASPPAQPQPLPQEQRAPASTPSKLNVNLSEDVVARIMADTVRLRPGPRKKAGAKSRSPSSSSSLKSPKHKLHSPGSSSNDSPAGRGSDGGKAGHFKSPLATGSAAARAKESRKASDSARKVCKKRTAAGYASPTTCTPTTPRTTPSPLTLSPSEHLAHADLRYNNPFSSVYGIKRLEPTRERPVSCPVFESGEDGYAASSALTESLLLPSHTTGYGDKAAADSIHANTGHSRPSRMLNFGGQGDPEGEDSFAFPPWDTQSEGACGSFYPHKGPCPLDSGVQQPPYPQEDLLGLSQHLQDC